jgi:hypothetical protein
VPDKVEGEEEESNMCLGFLGLFCFKARKNNFEAEVDLRSSLQWIGPHWTGFVCLD